ncbi:hypothetical protein [Halomarina oriensis]|uniref:Uncharacterized protein n=1 Tax=Halomarina oriensis TaxID=671145 RepID=A0A6B0GK00_9EURY|nr:hypothetical protein [Halomarina oriensis]MWG34157.1 hypothetical protein [Halomarina oriensis]
MGSRQFQQTIRTDTDVSVNVNRATINEAVGVEEDGSAYPYSVDPSGDIREIVVTDCGDVVMHCVGTGGTEWDVPLNGGTGSFDQWELERIEFRDPSGTGAALSAVVSHE